MVKQNNIAIIIDTALSTIEKDNAPLKGALLSNHYSGLGLDRAKLTTPLDEVTKIDTLRGLQGELSELLKQEAESRKELLDVFKSLGYEIK